MGFFGVWEQFFRIQVSWHSLFVMKRSVDSGVFSPNKRSKPTHVAKCGTELVTLVSKSQKNMDREYISCSCDTNEKGNVFVMWKDQWEKKGKPVVRCRNQEEFPKSNTSNYTPTNHQRQNPTQTFSHPPTQAAHSLVLEDPDVIPTITQALARIEAQEDNLQSVLDEILKLVTDIQKNLVGDSTSISHVK